MMSDPAAHLSALPLPGDMFGGKYRIERVLGAGGMGVVVAARHIKLDERFAIKFLRPEAGTEDHRVERFMREGRAVTKIRSEHVVRVHDVDTSDGGAPYMIMEYLEGRDLDAILESEGPIPADVAVDYVLQACEAIAEAHALGIVHRDVKPANLFLATRSDGSPCIKVLDFGISKMVPSVGWGNEITNTTAIMGSPQYMSPEQLRSTRDVDGRTDIWSLGVVLHELITGASPFAGDTMPEISANILKEPPVRLRSLRPDLPEGLEVALITALQKDLSLRFASIAQLASALAPFGTEMSVRSAGTILRVLRTLGAGPVGGAPMPRRSGGRPLARLAAIGVAVGVLGGAGVAYCRHSPVISTARATAVVPDRATGILPSRAPETLSGAAMACGDSATSTQPALAPPAPSRPTIGAANVASARAPAATTVSHRRAPSLAPSDPSGVSLFEDRR